MSGALGKAIAAAALLLGLALYGCGGGASSYNLDAGHNYDGHGSLKITRTLENTTDYTIEVNLSVNGSDQLDTLTIAPHDTATVVIEGLGERDEMAFHADYSNGDSTSGSFNEDGRTIFTYTETRAPDGSRAHCTSLEGPDVVNTAVKPARIIHFGSYKP